MVLNDTSPHHDPGGGLDSIKAGHHRGLEQSTTSISNNNEILALYWKTHKAAWLSL